MAPSWAIWVIPFTNCFRFMVSICRTRAKCSGAKVGIPSNANFSDAVVIVSPMEKIPGSKTPIISPAYASSMIFRSWAIICWGWDKRIFRCPWIWVTSMPASNFPEQILIKAMRSRWALFIFAWILKTNAEKSSENGSIVPISACLGSGEVVICRKCCKKVSTPKLVKAEPKNTGDNSPFATNSISNSALAPSKSSTSSSNAAL